MSEGFPSGLSHSDRPLWLNTVHFDYRPSTLTQGHPLYTLRFIGIGFESNYKFITIKYNIHGMYNGILRVRI